MGRYAAPDPGYRDTSHAVWVRAVENRTFVVQPVDERRSRSWCTLEQLAGDFDKPALPKYIQNLLVAVVIGAGLLACYAFIPWLVKSMLVGD